MNRPLVLFVFMLAASSGYAQKVRVPVTIAEKELAVPIQETRASSPCFKEESTDRLEDLAKLYQQAQWLRLQDEASCILDLLDDKTKNSDLFRPELHYYSVVFAAKGFAPDRQVFRLLLHREHAEARYKADLTTRLLDVSPDGKRELREVFLSLTPQVSTIDPPDRIPPSHINIRSTYTFTRTDNPLVMQLGDFAKQFPTAIAALPIL